MTGVFPSVLKTSDVVHVFKKDSKLDYSTITQSPCYKILKKIHEKHMYETLYIVNIV